MSRFAPSTETSKKVVEKILIYGPPHTSKTHAALGFPKPAIIDVENRAGHFAIGERFKFMHAQPRTMANILDILDEAKTGELQCKSIIIDSYSAIHEKLVAQHTRSWKDNEGQMQAVTDYATVNRRIAPVREFIFQAVDEHLIVIAHQQQKFDRVGKVFNARKKVEFQGDDKFRFAFDYIFRTQPTGDDPKVSPVQFIVDSKSASPRLKIGDVILVRPGESFYDLFRARTGLGETKPPATQQVAAPSPAAAPAAPVGPVTQEQIDAIEVAVGRLHLPQMELASLVKHISRGTPHYRQLSSAHAQRLVVVLHERLKGAA